MAFLHHLRPTLVCGTMGSEHRPVSSREEQEAVDVCPGNQEFGISAEVNVCPWMLGVHRVKVET